MKFTIINQILHGDCKELLKSLPDNSVDSIITDPPYELGFMNKAWDKTGIAYDVDMWKECLRVLKHGGYLLSFGGTRTYHRMACAIEDAGFEIRDQIQWIYAQGFPKSQDVGKQIIKKYKSENDYKGWGTALKPAHEPIVMARKPLSEKTVVDNIIKHGTGAINIDDCRVEYRNEADLNLVKAKCNFTEKSKSIGFGTSETLFGVGNTPLEQARGCVKEEGRFPANVMLDEVAGKILDEQSGERPSGKSNGNATVGENSNGAIQPMRRGNLISRNDTGGASRFFFCPKASKKERGEENSHTTVKPLKLMEYLVTLVTPKNGTVLDPFAGSGTTLVAAKNLNFDYIGIEREKEYINIIEKRLEL